MSFPGQRLQRAWHLVDAEGQTVGRLAGQIAALLKGKHKPTFKPNKDMGDVVVVVNADKVAFTSNKWKQKLYRWHTGYPGGLKQRTAQQMVERNPTAILRKAVLGMCRRNKLRHGFMEKRLRIYTGPQHPHTAQLPPTATTAAADADSKDDSAASVAGVEPLPRVPKTLNGNFHFGLQYYAHPASYQEQLPRELTLLGQHHNAVSYAHHATTTTFAEESRRRQQQQQERKGDDSTAHKMEH